MSIAKLKRIIIFYKSQYIIIYKYYRGLNICNFRYYYQYTFSSKVILVFLTIISYYKIMKDKKALYEEQAKIFHALANPVRLYIINELSDKECCLCELTEKIPLDKSTISRHMKVLRDTGIIGTRKERNTIYYNLKIHCILNYVKCVNSLIVKNIKEQIKIIE